MKVAVALVEEYTQPTPQPSEQIVAKAKALVAELSADDWKQRDRAETQLVGLGPVIIPTLKQLRTDQTPEPQQRIDSVLKTLEQKSSTTASAPAAAPGAPAPQAQVQQIEVLRDQ